MRGRTSNMHSDEQALFNAKGIHLLKMEQLHMRLNDKVNATINYDTKLHFTRHTRKKKKMKQHGSTVTGEREGKKEKRKLSVEQRKRKVHTNMTTKIVVTSRNNKKVGQSKEKKREQEQYK